MKTNKLNGKRAAIIGLGRMGIRHIDAYTSLGATIIAAADMKPEAIEAARPKYPNVHFYTDWEALIAKEAVDIVSVVTNGPSHAEIVIVAAERKIPVIFCEKPMATNMRDADRMVEACMQSGSRLFINMTRRTFESYERLFPLVRDGLIGDVRNITVVIAGGRGLGCVGSHFLDLMRFFFQSDPVRVWGHIDAGLIPNPRGALFFDPGGFGVYEFKNGARGIIEMSEDLYLSQQIFIYGSYGYIVIDEQANRWNIYHYPKSTRLETGGVVQGVKTEQISFPTEPFDLTKETARAIQDINSEHPVMAAGEDGKKALEMVLGLHISRENGNKPTTLPLQGEDRNYDVPMT